MIIERIKDKMNKKKAMIIFLELFKDLTDSNLYGVVDYVPVFLCVPQKDVNDQINNHIANIAAQDGLYFNYTESLDPNGKSIVKYELSFDPINSHNKIINLDDYRLQRSLKY